ncbi:MAG TPA: glycosyltransferase, partial [Gemmatales bacterium]|nr:glycosyltransferase [Gemmatales bacterium]
MMQRLFSWLRRPPTATPSDERLDYPAWRRQRLVDRANLYPAPKPPIGFSILTAVQNPPPPLLDALAQSIFQQEYPHFEWVIVDNGSNLTTQRRLTQLTRDPRVVLVPSPVNRGIVGGLRLALRSARNEYILPVDHDDELTPDALRVVAASLAALGRPAVAYTDEDKLLPDGTPAHPFFKPDWDPLLFLNCCYTAHLGVMKREAALAVGAYTDEQAQGSPDWDAFSRLVAAGHRPRHIAEIVYSWRMHAGSTAQGGSAAKPYTLAGQYHVLQQHLARTGLGRHLTIRANPLLGDVGWWRATAGTRRRRRRDDLVILERAVHDDSFRLAVDYLPPGAIVAIQASEATPATADWFQEPLALLDAFPEAVAVGGVLITRRGRLVAGPGVMGMDGLAGWPGRGGRRGDLLGAGTLVHQHRASLVDDRFFLVRGDFLKEMLPDAGADFAISLLGPWVGATARRLGRTV